MTPAGDTQPLSNDDQLSLWVGRVARVHAGLEYNVSNVYEFLREHRGRERALKSRSMSFDQLARTAIELLDEADLAADITTAGREALEAGRIATGERNRVVHDMWLPDTRPTEDETLSWTVVGRLRSDQPYGHATTRDLADLVNTHDLLLHTRLRISGLFMALHELISVDDFSSRPSSADSQIPRYLLMMRGAFALAPNGDIEFAASP